MSPIIISSVTEKYDRFFLIDDKGAVSQLNKNLDTVKTFKIPEIGWPTDRSYVDIDGDHDKEIIFISEDRKKLVITRSNFSHPILVDVPNEGGSMVVTVKRNGDKNPNLSVQIGTQWYLFNYLPNPLYYFKYAVWFGIYAALFLFLWTTKRIWTKKLEKDNIRLNQIVKDRTAELETNITHLRQTQKQLVEAEKMASLGGLVAGVAHEINTPVGIGITAASTLSDITGKLIDAYKQGKMKKSDLDVYLDNALSSSELILKNLQRTGELVKSFKQVSVDQVTEQKREFNFGSYVEDIVRSLHPKLKQTKLQVELDCKDDILMNSFPGPFAQIITNFIVNSIIHGFPENSGGLLRIEGTSDGKNLTFIYSDNGKGMAQDVLQKVFDPFFTTDKQRGTGLGMHIVYNLVKQKLKGDIKAWSEPGKGVRFTITVPLTV